MKHEIVLTMSMFPDRETALGCARTLVENGAVACAQVTAPVTSVFIWKGESREDTEAMLTVKTTSSLAEAVCASIREIHPYEVPEIITVPIISGFPGYIEWVADSVGRFNQ